MRMESIVFKWILVVILFLLYTLMRWVCFNKFPYFLFKLSFFLIYISWFHVRMGNLWNLNLAHNATTYRIVSSTSFWRCRTISLINLVDLIFLENRKLQHLIFEVILFVLIIVTHFGYFTTILITFALFVTHSWLQFSLKLLVLIF